MSASASSITACREYETGLVCARTLPSSTWARKSVSFCSLKLPSKCSTSGLPLSTRCRSNRLPKKRLPPAMSSKTAKNKSQRGRPRSAPKAARGSALMPQPRDRLVGRAAETDEARGRPPSCSFPLKLRRLARLVLDSAFGTAFVTEQVAIHFDLLGIAGLAAPLQRPFENDHAGLALGGVCDEADLVLVEFGHVGFLALLELGNDVAAQLLDRTRHRRLLGERKKRL